MSITASTAKWPPSRPQLREIASSTLEWNLTRRSSCTTIGLDGTTRARANSLVKTQLCSLAEIQTYIVTQRTTPSTKSTLMVICLSQLESLRQDFSAHLTSSIGHHLRDIPETRFTLPYPETVLRHTNLQLHHQFRSLAIGNLSHKTLKAIPIDGLTATVLKDLNYTGTKKIGNTDHTGISGENITGLRVRRWRKILTASTVNRFKSILGQSGLVSEHSLSLPRLGPMTCCSHLFGVDQP